MPEVQTDNPWSLETLRALTLDWGLDILGALLIVIVGWVVARWAAGLVQSAGRRNERFDATIASILARVVRIGVLLLTGYAVLSGFGVDTAGLLAVFGAAGLAIGLALQGTLSNVASGVMLLSLRPFRIGDAVDIGGSLGVVEDIGLFITRLKTFDGLAVFMPNSQIWGKEIKNFARNPTRRVDLVFAVAYDDDVERAMTLIGEAIDADERVLAEPEPQIAVDSLGDSSVNVFARPWVARTDFLAVKTELLKNVKARFDAEGITIPFPQRDVHLIQDPGVVVGGRDAAD